MPISSTDPESESESESESEFKSESESECKSESAAARQSVILISDEDFRNDLIGTVASSAAESSITPESLEPDSEKIQWVSWQDFDQEPLRYACLSKLVVAVAASNAEFLDRRLGCLCRSFPGGVIVEIADDIAAPDELFFAHGFQKLASTASKRSLVAINDKIISSNARYFQYRLHDYKAVPDWLNARFWAHPERFHL